VIKKEEAENSLSPFAAQWADFCYTDMSTRLLPEDKTTVANSFPPCFLGFKRIFDDVFNWDV